MQFPGFIGPSYTLKSTSTDTQRTVNLYPEVNESGAGKSIAALIFTPGLRKLSTLGVGPSRGKFTASNGRAFAASGGTLYEITNPSSPVSRGSFLTTSGAVSMADNGVHLLCVDGFKGYTFKFSDNTFALISDPDFPVATYCAFQDQYLIVNDAETGNFFLSALSVATDWDGLDFAAAEAYPDKLIRPIDHNQQLILLGGQSTEGWFDSGDLAFPFSRIQGSVSGWGTESPDSFQALDNNVVGLMRDANGQGMLMRINNFSPVRVSTFAVENAIKAGTLSGATSWSYLSAGHTFYCLNVPGLKSTWCLDVSNGQWHERQSAGARHRAENHCMVSGRHIVGDYQNGNLYELTDDADTDNGEPKVWMRRAPHVSRETKQIRHDEFILDANVGESAKTVMLRQSSNGGKTWSSERWVSWALGEYGKRARWQRLGTARDRVYEVSGEGNVTLNAAYIEAQAGLH